MCGVALAVQFVLGPLAVWGFALAGRQIAPPPALDEMLWELMFGMLGLDHERLTWYHNGINRRLTDVHGHVIREILT